MRLCRRAIQPDETWNMAKGQMRGNREAKKPKQDKPKENASPPSLKGAVSLGERKK